MLSTAMIRMSTSPLLQGLLVASVAILSSTSLEARADTSKCTGQIRSQGFFITDIDSDWDRPFDKFEVIKGTTEYDLWVDKKTCRIVHQQIDSDRYPYR